MAEVDGKLITVLTDAAEKSMDINEDRAEKARQKAKEIMAGVKQGEEQYADAVAQLERAISRLRIAKRRSGSRMPNINQ